MKPYVIQTFKNDRGEVDRSRFIARQDAVERICQLPGAEITLTPEAETVYVCGTLSALTLSDYPPVGSFAVIFTSGQDPTVLTIPQTLVMPEDFTLEANTRYEIHVRDGFALAAGWENGPTQEGTET